ncbi:hypothetical protein Pcinc_018294 [Petrolisthes cinctipes]|uniref:Uncharacterized protein n=1 Tax=Petrolisthes cinctipes TaxID=88211 RepID=A0AAE1FME3_PETCI|nr:hypothetical protein Pcinc_018294 [Petrolisthes cinctipes]
MCQIDMTRTTRSGTRYGDCSCTVHAFPNVNTRWVPSPQRSRRTQHRAPALPVDEAFINDSTWNKNTIAVIVFCVVIVTLIVLVGIGAWHDWVRSTPAPTPSHEGFSLDWWLQRPNQFISLSDLSGDVLLMGVLREVFIIASLAMAVFFSIRKNAF